MMTYFFTLFLLTWVFYSLFYNWGMMIWSFSYYFSYLFSTISTIWASLLLFFRVFSWWLDFLSLITLILCYMAESISLSTSLLYDWTFSWYSFNAIIFFLIISSYWLSPAVKFVLSYQRVLNFSKLGRLDVLPMVDWSAWAKGFLDIGKFIIIFWQAHFSRIFSQMIIFPNIEKDDNLTDYWSDDMFSLNLFVYNLF